MKVERKADHAVSEASCKAATGKTLADWYKALDKHGGIAPGRRDLSVWLRDEHEVDSWWMTTIVNEYEIARGDFAKDGKPKGYSICPTKSIKASPKDCYAAFATAKALDAWFGPKHDVDLRNGGHWRNADGNRATIKKVNAGKNIRLIAEDEGLTPVSTWTSIRARSLRRTRCPLGARLWRAHASGDPGANRAAGEVSARVT